MHEAATGPGSRDVAGQLPALFTAEARRRWASGALDAGLTPPTGGGYLPCAAPSAAVPGEQGLYMRGECPEGAVVALYPGVVYDATDLPVMYRFILNGNGYVVFRQDGVLIDARPTKPSSDVYNMAVEREKAQNKHIVPPDANPWAVGHFANHPPPGMEDNVALVRVDLSPADVAAVGREWLPVVNFRPPAAEDVPLRTVLVVAKRDLHHGEELLLDYKLSSDTDRRPDWYAPVGSHVEATPVGAPTDAESA